MQPVIEFETAQFGNRRKSNKMTAREKPKSYPFPFGNECKHQYRYWKQNERYLVNLQFQSSCRSHMQSRQKEEERRQSQADSHKQRMMHDLMLVHPPSRD